MFANADPAEARAECRAQVIQALAWDVDVTHLDSHMGTVQTDARFFEIYLDLAVEFALPLRMPGRTADERLGFESRRLAAEKGVIFTDNFINPWGRVTADVFRERLPVLTAGVTEIFAHPVADGPELRGYDPDAAHVRAGDAAWFTSPELKSLLAATEVVPISYRPLRELQRAGAATSDRCWRGGCESCAVTTTSSYPGTASPSLAEMLETTMSRSVFAVIVGLALALATPAGALTLERVVLVQRHGVRPPTSTNAELARYAAAPWPDWPVPPGELTPHGEKTVALMGATLRAAYLAQGVIPVAGCPGGRRVVVWADGTDQRTRRSGEVLAESLAPGCRLKAAWAAPQPRDPIFGGSHDAACAMDADEAKAAETSAEGEEGFQTVATRGAVERLQAILTPDGCRGGPAACLPDARTAAAGGAKPSLRGGWGPAPEAAEDLLLEYAEGMPLADVGWGRVASAAQIASVMAVPHERPTELMRRDAYLSSRAGAVMGRLILAALAGESGPPCRSRRSHAGAGRPRHQPLADGRPFWPRLDVARRARCHRSGDDLGVRTLVRQRSASSSARPSTTRPSISSAAFAPRPSAPARSPASRAAPAGPMGSCPLETLRERALARIPPGCGQA